MSSRVVGLDIGSTAIRAVEVENPRRPRPTVTRYAEVPLPEGAAKRGEVVEPSTVAAALKKLWAAGRFSTKDVVLGIGGHNVVSRDLTVPRMPLQRIRESLAFQAQDLLPLPVEDAVLDFYPVAEETGEQGPVVRGLLIAATKQVVLANVAAVRGAGLNPVDIDLIPFAFARAVGTADAGLAAHVTVGAESTNVVILDHGVPQFVRVIPAGGDDVTRALMGRLDCPREDAEATKRRLGLSYGEDHERAAVDTIYRTTAELMTSIRNTLSYYQAAHEQAVFGLIRIAGGGSRLEGFATALSEVTRIPVEEGDPFARVGGKAIATADAGARDGMSLALGLALGAAA